MALVAVLAVGWMVPRPQPGPTRPAPGRRYVLVSTGLATFDDAAAEPARETVPPD